MFPGFRSRCMIALLFIASIAEPIWLRKCRIVSSGSVFLPSIINHQSGRTYYAGSQTNHHHYKIPSPDKPQYWIPSELWNLTTENLHYDRRGEQCVHGSGPKKHDLGLEGHTYLKNGYFFAKKSFRLQYILAFDHLLYCNFLTLILRPLSKMNKHTSRNRPL